MEKVVVSGVTASPRTKPRSRCEDLPDTPGVAGRMFAPLADASISVDMIVQNQAYDGTTDLTFTVPKGDRKRAVEMLTRARARARRQGRRADLRSTTRSARSRSSASACARTLASPRRCSSCSPNEGINIQLISTSEIKISCVIARKYAELAVRTLHDGFGLSLPPSERAGL